MSEQNEFNSDEHWQVELKGPVFISPLPYQDRFDMRLEGDVQQLFSVLFNTTESRNSLRIQLSQAQEAIAMLEARAEIKALFREHGKDSADYVPSCAACQWVDEYMARRC